MQSRVLSRKLTKGFLDRLYRHARDSGHPEVFEIPGFQLGLAIASLAGMAVDNPQTDFHQRAIHRGLISGYPASRGSVVGRKD